MYRKIISDNFALSPAMFLIVMVKILFLSMY